MDSKLNDFVQGKRIWLNIFSHNDATICHYKENHSNQYIFVDTFCIYNSNVSNH